MRMVTGHRPRVQACLRFLARINLAPRTLALIFLSQGLLAVLLLAVLVPPFENPDEYNHMFRVDQIAEGGVVATRYGGPGTSGGRVDLGIGAVDAVIADIRFHPNRKVSHAMLEAAGAVHWGRRGAVTFANTSVYAPILYAPSVAAIWLGRALGLSIVITLELCRCANGLADLLVASLAIALAGRFAPFLMIVLALPMSLSLLGALSQDGGLLAFAALSVGAFNRLAERGRRAPQWMLLLAVALALVGIGRPAYLPLAILPLLARGVSSRARLASCLGIIASISGWSLVAAHWSMINASAARGVNPRAQLHALLHHPAAWWPIAEHSFTWHQGMEGLPYDKEMIGVLGWLDVTLPGPMYPASMITLGLATLVVMLRGGTVLNARSTVLLFVAMAGALLLVFVLLYLTWSPVGFPFVDGVQGRYFLPIAMFLPLLLPGIRSRFERVVVPSIIAALACYPTVSAVATIFSVVRRYYV